MKDENFPKIRLSYRQSVEVKRLHSVQKHRVPLRVIECFQIMLAIRFVQGHSFGEGAWAGIILRRRKNPE